MRTRPGADWAGPFLVRDGRALARRCGCLCWGTGRGLPIKPWYVGVGASRLYMSSCARRRMGEADGAGDNGLKREGLLVYVGRSATTEG